MPEDFQKTSGNAAVPMNELPVCTVSAPASETLRQISGQNMEISVFYEKIILSKLPTTAVIKSTNHFAIQLQAVYF
jgi:hypothetical protein